MSPDADGVLPGLSGLSRRGPRMLSSPAGGSRTFLYSPWLYRGTHRVCQGRVYTPTTTMVPCTRLHKCGLPVSSSCISSTWHTTTIMCALAYYDSAAPAKKGRKTLNQQAHSSCGKARQDPLQRRALTARGMLLRRRCRASQRLGSLPSHWPRFSSGGSMLRCAGTTKTSRHDFNSLRVWSRLSWSNMIRLTTQSTLVSLVVDICLPVLALHTDCQRLRNVHHHRAGHAAMVALRAAY